MKKIILMGLVGVITFSAPFTFADGYSTNTNGQTVYSSGSAASGGYNVTPQSPATGYSAQSQTPPPPVQSTHSRLKEKEKVTISVNVPEITNELSHRRLGGFVIEKHRKHPRHDLEWVSIDQNESIPRDSVIGGYQHNPPATLYVCHASYRGGVHPGKVFNGACNFSWGGNEIVVSRYEILTSRYKLNWAPGSYGAVPPNAIEGGYQHDGRLFICQARYRGGVHPGKLYKEACLIGWGGQEVAIPEYYVLTR